MRTQQQARSALFGIATVVVLAANSAADILHVPGDYPTIQEAIVAALDGYEIIVAPGVYNEAIFFNGYTIVLRSSGGAEVTTIDATGLNQHVIRVILGEGPDAVLDGFTITGGTDGLHCEASSPTVMNCVFVGNSNAGIYNVSDSSPTVTDCTFAGNMASGGMYNLSHCSPTVTNCVFIDNKAHGMQNDSLCNPTVTNCIFLRNSTNDSGGGMSNRGYSNPTITNCIFADNTAGGVGGGIYNAGSSNATIVACTLGGNVASHGLGGGRSTTMVNPCPLSLTPSSGAIRLIRWPEAVK